MNRVQTLRAFFDDRPLTMDEMKALTKDERVSLANLCRDEMVRRGSHSLDSFKFDAE